MGAWDFGSFDNDDASDWLYELAESSDLSTILAALNTVDRMGGEYLEAPDCAIALAAAEIVAALRGHPVAKLPENAQAWVSAHRQLDGPALVPLALSVIQRIRTNSELRELWDESGDAAKWSETLDDLSSRLKA